MSVWDALFETPPRGEASIQLASGWLCTAEPDVEQTRAAAPTRTMGLFHDVQCRHHMGVVPLLCMAFTRMIG